MRLRRVLAPWALAWLSLGAPAWAQEGTSLAAEAARVDLLALRRGEPEVHEALLQEFAFFLGPEAANVLSRLRDGRPVEMTPPPGAGKQAPIRVAAPSAPMDWSDVCLALFLARARLAQRGIESPSSLDLQAALSGGKAPGGGRERWEGILPIRERGRPWGEIARALGEDLARLEALLRAWNERLAAGTPHAGEASGSEAEPVRITETGIVTGRGKSIPAYTPPPEGKKAIGEGILSGSGEIIGVPGRAPIRPPQENPPQE